MKLKNAQIFSIDMVLASLVFLIILVIIVSSWDTSLEHINIKEQRNNLEILARNAADLLVLTEGYPSNWSDSNISSLGIALTLSQNQLNSTYKSRPMGLNKRGAWNLDAAKILALQSINYSYSKQLLGLFRSDENYYVIVSVLNSSVYVNTYSFGLAPYNNASAIVTVERFALLSDKFAKLSLNIWQECEERLCL